MPESSTEQAPKGYNIALGKTVGERVLGIIPSLTVEQINALPIGDAFVLTRVRRFEDGSLALHLASRQFDGVAGGIDLGFVAQADAVAEHLEASAFDQTVRRISSGSLFDGRTQPHQS